jgi:hypothetical protein
VSLPILIVAEELFKIDLAVPTIMYSQSSILMHAVMCPRKFLYLRGGHIRNLVFFGKNPCQNSRSGMKRGDGHGSLGPQALSLKKFFRLLKIPWHFKLYNKNNGDLAYRVGVACFFF